MITTQNLLTLYAFAIVGLYLVVFRRIFNITFKKKEPEIKIKLVLSEEETEGNTNGWDLNKQESEIGELKSLLWKTLPYIEDVQFKEEIEKVLGLVKIK